MKKNVILLFLVFCASFVDAQTFQDCIIIDFESILDTPSEDGLIIHDQFQDTFGLTFSLEGGGFPRLAEVGGNDTAFGSIFGSDTPAPNQNIGSFFLTDDGVLQGLNAPPIILDFVSPVDSFSGCILDMDFGEIFIIEAFDIEGLVVLKDTVSAGDPGTGDGISTCWGFNLEGCEGSVYSIRFEGSRTQSGAFGMGMDNLVFCLSGIDIVTEVGVETTLVRCDGTLGSISLINTTGDELVYSIDGVNFQESPLFENLNSGAYTVTVKDLDGCEGIINEVVVSSESYSDLTEVITTDATCENNNGTISIIANNPEGLTYSLDGIDFQELPDFVDLSTGSYDVYILDSLGCVLRQSAVIENIDLLINDLLVKDTKCNEPNGSLEVIVLGFDNVSYSIDGENFQESPVFENLVADTYTIFIKDFSGCLNSKEATILPSEEVQLEVTGTNDWCNDGSGTLDIKASGGTGQFMYSINKGAFQSIFNFNGLERGTYSIEVEDNEGCRAESQITLDSGQPLIVNDVTANDPTCEDVFGSIIIESEGGNGQVNFALNDGDLRTINSFYGLEPGDFSIFIIDEEGCLDTLYSSLEYPICPIYIPNVFTPNRDGSNDLFEVFTNNIYDVDILSYAIFDRWGNELWEKSSFSLHKTDDSNWWDGSFRQKPCMTGVYVYMIEVQYINGATQIFSGDVTLLR